MGKLLILDAPSLIYRAFYALPSMTSTSGQTTNAVYGFCLMLFKLLNDEIPDYICACFDSPKPTFRHKKFQEYKITRPKTPDDLISQIQIIKELLSAFNISSFEIEGYEADDIIATIAEYRKGKCIILIVSGDLDILQIVEENVVVAVTKKGITDIDLYDIKKVNERYNLEPKQLIYLKALSGDKSDDIPRISGIGEKRAIYLLKKYGDLENIYKHLDEIEGEKIKDSLKEFKEQVFLNKELVELNRKIKIDIDSLDLEYKRFDENKVLNIFENLQFKSLIKRLNEIKSLKEKQLSLI